MLENEASQLAVSNAAAHAAGVGEFSQLQEQYAALMKKEEAASALASQLRDEKQVSESARLELEERLEDVEAQLRAATSRDGALHAQLLEAREANASLERQLRDTSSSLRREAAEAVSAELREAKAALYQATAELDARVHELASRNNALRSLGQQMLKLKEQLGVEREWSEQLKVPPLRRATPRGSLFLLHSPPTPRHTSTRPSLRFSPPPYIHAPSHLRSK